MTKIPKKIHYCWFGPNKLNPLALKCLNSWKIFAPDYEIILWNEENFDVNKYEFVRFAYEQKKYAFVSDFVRLYVLKEFGGVYLDSDVELIKNIDTFLINPAFSGFEDNNTVPTGIIASEKNGRWVSHLLDYYLFIEGDIKFIPNTKLITTDALKHNLICNNNEQYLNELDVRFYPSDYFCPKSHYTGKISLTENTYAIHHFSGSWLSPYQKIKRFFIKIFISIFGKDLYDKIKKNIR